MTEAAPASDIAMTAGGFRTADLRRFFSAALGFWRSERRLLAWGLTAGIVLLSICALLFQLRLNLWNRDFFDGLERRDWAGLTRQLWMFAAILAFGIVVAVGFVHARMTLQVRWREWLTHRLVRAWMMRGHAYQLDLAHPEIGNPEYRLANDIRLATEMLVDFVIGFLSAMLTAVAFAGVLFTGAGSLPLAPFGLPGSVPGYMVIAAVAYSLVATALMVRLGEPLVALTERRNQREAEFLFGLTRARQAAEGIALAGGQAAAREDLQASLSRAVAEWLAIMRRQMKLAVVGNANGVLLPVVPLLLLAPKYLIGEITLGQTMQLAAAFAFVVAALNWVFDNFQRFAEWTASVNRVAALDAALRRFVTAEAAGDRRIEVVWSDRDGLRIVDLKATYEDGHVLIADADVAIGRGERVLVSGESGTGKTTLVRAIAGLWPWGSGRVELPRAARIVVVPQAPFVPEGTLMQAALWPLAGAAADEATVREILVAVGLGGLAGRLGESARWDQLLGEDGRERLGFARALLQKPDILVLDEATSALDPASEAALYRLVLERLPGVTLVSFGHPGPLEAFHGRRLEMRHERGAGYLDDHGDIARPAPPPRGWRAWLGRLSRG